MDKNAWMMYLAENYKALQGLCYFPNGNGQKMFDEDAWNVVLDRLQRLFVTYDPDKGNIDMYVRGSLQWYIYKEYVKRGGRTIHSVGGLEDLVSIADSIAGDPTTEHYCREARSHKRDQELELAFNEAVSILSTRLTSYEFYLYIHHKLYGYTFQELADACGIGKTTMFSDMQAVNVKVRNIARTFDTDYTIDDLVTAVGCT